MSKNIITISREFGSGGRYIGKQVAESLGIAFYDKDIIAKVAEESGLDKDFIEKKGEYSPLKNVFSYAFVGRDSTGASLDDYLYSVQRKIILEIAEKEKSERMALNSSKLGYERCVELIVQASR